MKYNSDKKKRKKILVPLRSPIEKTKINYFNEKRHSSFPLISISVTNIQHWTYFHNKWLLTTSSKFYKCLTITILIWSLILLRTNECIDMSYLAFQWTKSDVWVRFKKQHFLVNVHNLKAQEALRRGLLNEDGARRKCRLWGKSRSSNWRG